MNSLLLRQSATTVVLRTAVALALVLLSLAVGVTCVVFPIAVPFGIVTILGAILLWTLPDLRHIPDGIAKMMIFPFVFSALCVPAYYTIIITGLPWISIRRLFLICLVAPTVIVLAGSSTYRHHLGLMFRNQRFTLVAILVFLTSLALSTLTSPYLSISLGALSVVATGTAVPFIAVLLFFRRSVDVVRLMGTLIVCNVIDFVVGFIEFSRQKPFLLQLLPASIQTQILSSADTYINLVTGQGLRNGLFRAASTFNVSLSWGEMAAMLGPIAAYFITHGRSSTSRAFGIVGIAASLGAIICSGARGAYLGFFVSMIMYALVWAIRLARTSPKSLAGAVAVLTMSIGAGAFGFAILVAGVGRRFIFGGGAQQNSTQARWEQWALAQPKVFARPWGYGPGTGAGVVNYAPFGSVTLDSYFITMLVECGLIGFLAWLLIYIIAISTALKTYVTSSDDSSLTCNALGCSLISFIVYRLTLSQQENMTTMSVILAMSVLSVKLVRERRSHIID